MVRAKTHFFGGKRQTAEISFRRLFSLSLSLRFLSPMMFGVLIRRVYGVYCEGEGDVSEVERG